MMTPREKQLTWIAAASTILSAVSFAVALRNATRSTIEADHLQVGDSRGWVTIDATLDGATLEIGSPYGTTRWEVDSRGARAAIASGDSRLVLDAARDRAKLALVRGSVAVATLEGDATSAQLRLDDGTGPATLRVDGASASLDLGHNGYRVSANASADTANVGVRSPDARLYIDANPDSAALTAETTGANPSAIDLRAGGSSAHFGARVHGQSLDVSLDEGLGGRIVGTRAGQPWDFCDVGSEAP